MFRSLLLAGCLMLATGAASAQWARDVQTDAFTGDNIVLVTNTGQVLDGDPGTTSLIWREANGEGELFWHNSSLFVCDSDMDVQIRFGEGAAEKALVTASSSNRAVFFHKHLHVLLEMVRMQKILLKLTDHCGNLIVAQFEGDPSPYVTGIEIFSDPAGWRVDSANYVTKSTGPAAVKFRRLVDGSEDFYFTLDAPQYRGKRATFSTEYPARIHVNGKRFDAIATHDIDTSDLRKMVSKGRLNILLGGQLSSELLSQLLGDTRHVTIEVDGQQHDVDLTGFEQAFKFG